MPARVTEAPAATTGSRPVTAVEGAATARAAAAVAAVADAGPPPTPRAAAPAAPTGADAPAHLSPAVPAATAELPPGPPAQPVAQPDRAPRFTPSQARALTFGGVALAGVGELYLQLAAPTTTSKAIGLLWLAVGAALFGLGAVTSLQAPCLQRMPPGRSVRFAIDRRGSAGIAAAVGALVFLTLIGRLLIGSTAGSDLLLWLIALAAFGMPFLEEIRIARPSAGQAAELGCLALLMIVMIVVTAHDLNSWLYSAIGDEYAFFWAAQAVLTDGIRRPFAQDGVYNAHPILGTIFQAGVMAIFGRDHFGWMLSSVLSLAMAMPGVYLLGRILAGRGVAILSTALFGFSHYVFAFSHIGPDNAMAQTPTAWALAFFALSLRKRVAWPLYASGVAAGLGFYTFYSARTIMPILALFVVVQQGWRASLTLRAWRDRLGELWPLGLGFVVAVAPILVVSGTAVVTQMFVQVPGGYSEAITGPPGQKILTNAWLNIPAFFQNSHTTLYVSGSLLDPVSAVLAALGIGLALRWWSETSSRLVLAWTFVSVAVTGLLSPHPTTAITRLLCVIPPLAMLGGLAACQIWRAIPVRAPGPTRQWAAIGAGTALVCVVLTLNMYRFFVQTPNRMHLTREAIVMRALRSPLCGPETAHTIIVARDNGLIGHVLRSYGLERELPRFIAHGDLKPGQPITIGTARCVVFGDPDDEPARRAIDDLRRVYPSGELIPVRDQAGIGSIAVFLPSPGEAGL
jgi:hypothetical protein